MNKIFGAVAVVAALGLGYYAITSNSASQNAMRAEENAGAKTQVSQNSDLVADYKSVHFYISGESIQMENGLYEEPSAPGSSSMTSVRYFGNEVRHDIDGDGDEDVVFLVTEQSAGTGTFYYAVAAINEGGKYKGSNALLIGDRIAPQTTEKGEGKLVIINYADRASGEPMTTKPSHGKSLYVLYNPSSNALGEAVQNFEGESR